MSTLNGQPIKDTYTGLIKTSDNAAIGGTLKALEDGAGNTLPIEVSATEVNFTGTVTGVPAGPQGPQGPEGPQGITGAQGPQGPKGDGTVETIVAGTNITVDATDPANPVVSAAGGGGGATPPIDLKNLPPWGGSPTFSRYSYRTWCATNGYSLAGDSVPANRAAVAIYSMREGEEINRLLCAVDTAQPGALLNIAIYEVIEVNGYTKLGNKLKDVASVDASTTGSKVVDIQSDPFVMPAGQDFGAIGIAHAFTLNGCSIEAWSQTISGAWTGNGGADNAGTFYRAMGLFVNDIVAGTLPADLSANECDADTSLPVYSAISSGTQNATS